MSRETLSVLASWIPAALALAMIVAGLATSWVAFRRPRPRVGPGTPFWGWAACEIKAGDVLFVVGADRDQVIPGITRVMDPIGNARRSFATGEPVHRCEVGPFFDPSTHAHYDGTGDSPGLIAGVRLWKGDLVYIGKDGRVYPCDSKRDSSYPRSGHP